MSFPLEQIISMGAGCSTETEMGPDNSLRNSSLYFKTAMPGVRSQEFLVWAWESPPPPSTRCSMSFFLVQLRITLSLPTPSAANVHIAKEGSPASRGLLFAELMPFHFQPVDAPSSLLPANGIAPQCQCLLSRCGTITGHLGYHCGLDLWHSSREQFWVDSGDYFIAIWIFLLGHLSQGQKLWLVLSPSISLLRAW